MCLFVFKNKVKIKKTLFTRTYYKILEEGLTAEGRPYIITPYLCFNVELGKDYSIDPEKKWDIIHDRILPNKHIVEGNCFHLYKRKHDAIADLNTWGRNIDSHKYFVVKAIVPKGTEYIEGEWGFTKVICVRQVRYEKL